jgi:pimeloyl-ACP methyl ester carboxylesterase
MKPPSTDRPRSGPPAPATPRRRTFPGPAGTVMVADAYGPQDAPAVLLLHGGGQTRHAWGGAARALGEQGWHAVALDLPGHGDSGWPEDGDYTIRTIAESVARTVRALGRPVALVGASLGGLASMAALDLPDPLRIDALVLVDIAPRTEEPGVRRIVSFMTAHPEGFASLDEAAAHIAAYKGQPVGARSEGLRKNLRLNEAGRWVWHWDPRLMHDRNHADRRDPEAFERGLRRLGAPSLLVRGRRSDVITEAGARAFLEAVPGARYIDLQDAGHMVAGDANDAFTASVTHFLREAMPPAPAAETPEEPA